MLETGLTDDEIAVLCDIGDCGLAPKTEDKKRILEGLISEGYVSLGGSDASSRFKLTAKAVDFLGKRGVGLNES